MSSGRPGPAGRGEVKRCRRMPRAAWRRSGKIGADVTRMEAADRVDIPTQAAVLPKVSRAAAHRVVEPVQSVQPGRKEGFALSKRSRCLFSVARPGPHTQGY